MIEFLAGLLIGVFIGITLMCILQISRSEEDWINQQYVDIVEAKLFTLLMQKYTVENMEKANSIKGEIKKIEWGSQIRSYVFQPYTLVKDHRTGFENSDVSAVMDGEIAPFINDYLRKS